MSSFREKLQIIQAITAKVQKAWSEIVTMDEANEMKQILPLSQPFIASETNFKTAKF